MILSACCLESIQLHLYAIELKVIMKIKQTTKLKYINSVAKDRKYLESQKHFRKILIKKKEIKLVLQKS